MHTPTPAGPRIRPHRRVTGSETGTTARTITPVARDQAHPRDAAPARTRHPARDGAGALWLHLDLPRLPLEVLTRGGAGQPVMMATRARIVAATVAKVARAPTAATTAGWTGDSPAWSGPWRPS